MTTRREFGRGLAAIIAAGTAPSIILPCEAHNAGLLRGVGARNAMMGGGGGWVNPYVTDGLVAMWDGEWNVAGGVHDANPDAWVDLIGGVRLTCQSLSFGDKYCNVTGDPSAPMSDNESRNWPIGNEAFSIELCCYVDPSAISPYWGSVMVSRGLSYDKALAFAISATRGQQVATNFLFFLRGTGYAIDESRSGFVHLTATRERDSSVVNVYSNGEFLLSINSAVAQPERNRIAIGGNPHETNPTASISTKGRYFAVRIYRNLALSATDVLKNYAVDHERFWV